MDEHLIATTRPRSSTPVDNELGGLMSFDQYWGGAWREEEAEDAEWKVRLHGHEAMEKYMQ